MKMMMKTGRDYEGGKILIQGEKDEEDRNISRAVAARDYLQNFSIPPLCGRPR